MKKLIYLLVLCLCLNGTALVLAESGGAKVTSTTSEKAGKEAAAKKKAKKKAEKEAKKKAEEEAQKKAEQEAKKKAEREAKKAEKEAAKKAEKEAKKKAEEEAKKAEKEAAEEAERKAAEDAREAEAPAEAPAEQPAEAPVEQPAEVPAEQPAEAPVEQPAEAPVEQPAEAPAEPAEAPVEPAIAPADPVEAPAEPTEAPAEPAEAPAEPTEVPAEPTEAPAEPTEAPAEPTEAPAEPTEAPAEPTEAPAEPTEAPAEPIVAPAEPTEAPALPEDAEAWFERDGVKLGGKLKDTIALLNGNEKLYLRARKPVRVKKAPLKRLSGIELLPDEEVFKGEYEALVFRDDPAKGASVEPIDLKSFEDCKDDETDTLYFWVRKVDEAPEPTAAPTEAPKPTAAPVLTVKAKRFEPATWLNRAPQFKLSGKPKDDNWMYAAIIYDERVIPMSGNTYEPEREGVYTLRFALLDGIGDIVSASEQYTLWLDMTPPEQVDIQVDETADYTLYVTAADAMSGVQRVSLNGGKKWHDLADGETFTYTGQKARTFLPGDILVQDAAGNLYESAQEYTVEKAEPEEPPDNGGGWGGGGGGDKKPAKTHAAGDGEEKAEYDAVALEVPEAPMKRLELGGEELALSLVLESAQGPDAPVGEDQLFTAALCHWDVPAPVDADGEPRQPNPGDDPDALNTLLLSAQPDASLGDRFTYEWRFNGEVYRLLNNSGIQYVALKVGDDVAAFPTEGFTGGTKYTELKMLGVSTRKFDYTLAMKVNRDPAYVSAMSDSDFSQACDLSIRAEVENMAYELSSSTNSIMYFYDVYLGPETMLKQPFGEYRAQ